MQILVIDDSRATRAMVCRIVAELDPTAVHTAGDGREALEVLASVGPVDLALVDWNMPEMNGIEFVRTVRSDPRHAATTLVMVTTESEIDHVVLALESGADEYLMKPFSAAALREKLTLLGVAGVVH